MWPTSGRRPASPSARGTPRGTAGAVGKLSLSSRSTWLSAAWGASPTRESAWAGTVRLGCGRGRPRRRPARRAPRRTVRRGGALPRTTSPTAAGGWSTLRAKCMPQGNAPGPTNHPAGHQICGAPSCRPTPCPGSRHLAPTRRAPVETTAPPLATDAREDSIISGCFVATPEDDVLPSSYDRAHETRRSGRDGRASREQSRHIRPCLCTSVHVRRLPRRPHLQPPVSGQRPRTRCAGKGRHDGPGKGLLGLPGAGHRADALLGGQAAAAPFLAPDHARVVRRPRQGVLASSPSSSPQFGWTAARGARRSRWLPHRELGPPAPPAM